MIEVLIRLLSVVVGVVSHGLAQLGCSGTQTATIASTWNSAILAQYRLRGQAL
jgi:hypothetical protein